MKDKQWRCRNTAKLRTSKGDYWIKQWFSSIVSLFQMVLFQRKEFSYGGSEFFPLRVVPYGMENHFNHIMWPPWNVTIFITHVCNCVMGAMPMIYLHLSNQVCTGAQRDLNYVTSLYVQSICQLSSKEFMFSFLLH